MRSGDASPIYEVDSESGTTYWVDVDAAPFTCPAHTSRNIFCERSRPVDREIRAPRVGPTTESSGTHSPRPDPFNRPGLAKVPGDFK